jgi:hypothetical protein
MKSETVSRQLFPAAFALGKELIGNPIAPLVIIAAAITKSLGWPIIVPIFSISGITIIAQTDEDKKFDTKQTANDVIKNVNQQFPTTI